MVVTVPSALVMVAMATGVALRFGSALTGRLRSHSTTGLAVVPATVLSLAKLGQVVRKGQAQLGPERRVVGPPVRERGYRTGFRPRFRVWFGHANQSRIARFSWSFGATLADRRTGLGMEIMPGQ